jgi:uncharacterized membrane protein YidH (DUF202 family)
MEYLWAFLILAGIFALTSMLTGVLGLLIPISYALFGFILGAESLIMGLGGLLGSIINYYNANRYIRTQGAMSHAPRYSMLASIGFIVVFVVTIVLKYAFKVKMDNINYWYLLIFAFAAWIVLRFIFNSNRTQTLDRFKQSVVKYKILEKYNDDPKWATYLYFENGEEGWNQTIPGSFLAKNPETDLTFVHNTKEDALRYAKSTFESAEYLEN